MAARRSSRLSGEDRLIAQYFKPLAKHPGALGLSDDAAFIKPPSGCDIVLTVDAIVSGVHFLPDDPAETVARKALGVNLSDLAAKGARPLGCLLTLALPGKTSAVWLAGFARGLRRETLRLGCPLLGGDTVRTPGPLSVSVTAFGAVPSRRMVRRAGARAGDIVYVSGTIGDATLGLLLRQKPGEVRRLGLEAKATRRLIDRYRVPRPRLLLAEALRRHASAAMDVSDGLVGDLRKLCRASDAGAEIESGLVPLSKDTARALAARPRLLDRILSGGDDYEVLCSVRPSRAKRFEHAASAAGVPVTRIGQIVRGSEVRVAGPDGRPMRLARGSFSHF